MAKNPKPTPVTKMLNNILMVSTPSGSNFRKLYTSTHIKGFNNTWIGHFYDWEQKRCVTNSFHVRNPIFPIDIPSKKDQDTFSANIDGKEKDGKFHINKITVFYDDSYPLAYYEYKVDKEIDSKDIQKFNMDATNKKYKLLFDK